MSIQFTCLKPKLPAKFSCVLNIFLFYIFYYFHCNDPWYNLQLYGAKHKKKSFQKKGGFFIFLRKNPRDGKETQRTRGQKKKKENGVVGSRGGFYKLLYCYDGFLDYQLNIIVYVTIWIFYKRKKYISFSNLKFFDSNLCYLSIYIYHKSNCTLIFKLKRGFGRYFSNCLINIFYEGI